MSNEGVPGDIGVVDLQYLGLPGQVCAAVVPTRTGFLLVDCGPAVTLERLLAGLADFGFGIAELRGILLTHIHLDHAGAAGALAAMAPKAQVFVHGANGAPHLRDPGKLMRSARRLYGERLEELFGDMAPLPGEQVVELAGGESLTVDGRQIEVLAAPGHAWHHLAYVDAETKVLFAGDAVGLREPGSQEVLPYTPPPDIDLEAWTKSLETIRAARPAALLLAHFGLVYNPPEHLGLFERGLMEWSEIAREIARNGLGLEEAGVEFANRIGREASRAFDLVANIEHCGRGLVRYWTKVALPIERS